MPGKRVASAAADAREPRAGPRPGLSFPPSSALTAHAYLRGCRSPHSPFSQPPLAPPLPAPLPADSLARTSLGLPLADWLRPSGPGDVISETWQPGESAPHGGGGGEGEGRDRGRCRQLAEEGGGDPGTLRAGERGVGSRGTAWEPRWRKRELGGLGSCVPFAGLTCFRLELPRWSQDVRSKDGRRLEGPLRKTLGLWKTRSLSFPFSASLNQRHWAGYPPVLARPFYFLISYCSLSSPALSTSAWILQQSPSGLSASASTLPQAICTHIQIYLPETFPSLTPHLSVPPHCVDRTQPWAKQKLVVFLPWFQPSGWNVLIFSCCLILSHSTRLESISGSADHYCIMPGNSRSNMNTFFKKPY